MHLSKDYAFICRGCGQEIAAEDAIKLIEADTLAASKKSID
jgi:hypothetical protein